MKKTKNVLFLLVIVTLLSGCATSLDRQREQLNSRAEAREKANSEMNEKTVIENTISSEEHEKKKEESRQLALELMQENEENNLRLEAEIDVKENKRQAAINQLPENERDSVRNRQIFIGMSRNGVILSWGEPTVIHESVNQWSTHEQFVYRDSGFYVYVDDDIVSSWSN